MTHDEYLQMIEDQGYTYRFIHTSVFHIYTTGETEPLILLSVVKDGEKHITLDNSWRENGSTTDEATQKLRERFPQGRFADVSEVDPYDS